jgi:hypothetical protein
VSLPGEISTARDRESGSAVRSNALGDGREVSRGHSSGDANRGAETRPCKRRNPQARSVKDRTESMARPGHPPATTSPALWWVVRAGIGAGQRKRGHAPAPLFRKERRRTFVIPRDDTTFRNRRATDPYGRWCGGSGFKPRSYPISPWRRWVGAIRSGGTRESGGRRTLIRLPGSWRSRRLT